MSRAALLFAALAAALLYALSAPLGSHAASTACTPDPTSSAKAAPSQVAPLIAAINKQRAAAGLAPFVATMPFERLAMYEALHELAAPDSFDADTLASGCDLYGWEMGWGYGYANANAAVSAWMHNSDLKRLVMSTTCSTGPAQPCAVGLAVAVKGPQSIWLLTVNTDPSQDPRAGDTPDPLWPIAGWPAVPTTTALPSSSSSAPNDGAVGDDIAEESPGTPTMKMCTAGVCGTAAIEALTPSDDAFSLCQLLWNLGCPGEGTGSVLLQLKIPNPGFSSSDQMNKLADALKDTSWLTGNYRLQLRLDGRAYSGIDRKYVPGSGRLLPAGSFTATYDGWNGCYFAGCNGKGTYKSNVFVQYLLTFAMPRAAMLPPFGWHVLWPELLHGSTQIHPADPLSVGGDTPPVPGSGLRMQQVGRSTAVGATYKITYGSNLLRYITPQRPATLVFYRQTIVHGRHGAPEVFKRVKLTHPVQTLTAQTLLGWRSHGTSWSVVARLDLSPALRSALGLDTIAGTTSISVQRGFTF